MIAEIREIKSEKGDLRKFGLAVGTILLLIAGLLFWREKASFRVFLAIGLFLFAFGAVLPGILRPAYRVWMIFAIILSWFMTRVTLGLLFYGVFTPIGFVSRLFGKQFLDLKWDKSQSSYWNYRTAKPGDKMNYDRQF